MRPAGVEHLAPHLLSWNLRNLREGAALGSPDVPALEGAGAGEFPVDAWGTFHIEVPAGPFKTDLSGRSFHAFGVSVPPQEWNLRRTVALPVYRRGESLPAREMRELVARWPDIMVTDDIPCLALAAKATGRYCEEREAQSVSVLLAWSDGSARTVRLDWSEGSLEDCVTPEWCVLRSELGTLNPALAELSAASGNVDWCDRRFWIYAIPSGLGSGLRGERGGRAYKFWGEGWSYSSHADMRSDLSLLVDRVRETLSWKGGDLHGLGSH